MNENKPLKVLIVASEVAPYAKSGGLGDVTGSLPRVLKEQGVDVRVVLPKYKTIKTEYFSDTNFLGDFNVSLSWRNQKAGILEKSGDVTTYFVENDYYFGRDGYYGYQDDNERFAFFGKAVLDMLQFIDFYPDIIHCNDWQTGPIPMMLKETYSKFTFYKDIKTLYTIHNLQYQGRFSRETIEMFDVPWYCFDNCEFYGQLSYSKAGLMYADMISTVSKTYAEEIKTFQYGYGLDGVLRYRSDKLCGILNGIDYRTNNPETDERILINYGVDCIEKKKENKYELQKQLGMNVGDAPMISIISRLADQKGLDLVAWVAEQLLNYDIQLVVLGTGERRFEDFFRELEWRYKGRVSANILFDDTLAQRIYASSDMFLMPSLFEPCGLGQMFSLRYGTVPIVRKTGGLSDTVHHYNRETKEGNGFVFEHYTADGLMWAIKEGISVYNQGADEWNNVVINAMKSENSWRNSAKEYIAVYNKIKEG
ncbi:MAG TPA: glycogen synthase GlgA [Lachnospiraceae bacterium]|nr:glycogen synthase GlgA [Lachnospiraceae bacterium]